MTETPSRGVECILCGHDGHDDGVFDAAGDWYCDVCSNTAPAGEVPADD